MTRDSAPVLPVGQTLPPFGTRRVAVTVAVLALLAALAIGAVVMAGGGAPLGIDRAWMDTLLGIRTPAGEAFGLFMNSAGGGLVGIYLIPGGIVLLLLWRKKVWSAIYLVAAALGATAVIQILKHLVGRARPDDMLMHSDFGSFPSGHSSHAAVLAVVAFVFVPRLWVAVAGSAWALLMAFSRNYVGAHWLSDVVAGALIGAAVAVLVLTPLAERVAVEWKRGPAHPELEPGAL